MVTQPRVDLNAVNQKQWRDLFPLEAAIATVGRLYFATSSQHALSGGFHV